MSAGVYALGRHRGTLPTATLLLAGVTLSFFFSALILLLQYVGDFVQTFRALRWLMGEVRIVGFTPLAVFAPLLLLGALLVLRRRAELNHLLTGEELAQARGVPVERVKLELFLGCSMMVGAVVALCGPIGFVGLIVPHTLRLFIGRQRRLAPSSVPAEAAFLVICDTSEGRLAPAELPVGVFTAIRVSFFFLQPAARKGTRSLSLFAALEGVVSSALLTLGDACRLGLAAVLVAGSAALWHSATPLAPCLHARGARDTLPEPGGVAADTWAPATAFSQYLTSYRSLARLPERPVKDSESHSPLSRALDPHSAGFGRPRQAYA